MFCPKCGSENKSECKFCVNCGQSFRGLRNILMENSRDDFIRKSEDVTKDSIQDVIQDTIQDVTQDVTQNVIQDATQVEIPQCNVDSRGENDYQEEKEVISLEKNHDDFDEDGEEEEDEEENSTFGYRKKNIIIAVLIILACIIAFSWGYLYFYNKYSTIPHG